MSSDFTTGSDAVGYGFHHLIGQRLGDQYVVESFLAEGSYGYVFRGRDTALDRVVAIKFGRDGIREKDLSGEAKRVAKLDDLKENVVQVFGFGTYNSWPYMVMEFLPGASLETLWAQQHYRLDSRLIREFVKQIGRTLHAAHARGLVHRDLKPSNIQVVPKEVAPASGQESHRFVLLDFGISAKVNETSRTMQNLTLRHMGTLAYMSPEHLQGTEKPGEESLSDIYAFGVILYQLLTGEIPFAVSETPTGAAALFQTMEAKKHRPATFRRLAPDQEIPPGVERLVRKCLEIAPQKRPQTMGDVVQEFLAAWPESAAEPPSSTATSRRYWLVWMFLGVSALVAANFLVRQPWVLSHEKITLAPEDAEGARFHIAVAGGSYRNEDWEIRSDPALEITPLKDAEVPHSWSIRVNDPNPPRQSTITIRPKSFRLKSDAKSLDVEIIPRLEFANAPASRGVTRQPYESPLHRIGRWQLPDTVRIDVSIPGQAEAARVTLHLIECTEESIRAARSALPSPLNAELSSNRFPKQSFYLSDALVTWSMFSAYIAAHPEDVKDYFWRTARADADGEFLLLDPAQGGPIELEPDDISYASYVASQAASQPNQPATNLQSWMALRCCQWIAGPDATLPSAAEWDWACGFTNRSGTESRVLNVWQEKNLQKFDGAEMLRTVDNEADDLAAGLLTEKEARKVMSEADDAVVRRLKLRDWNQRDFPNDDKTWDLAHGFLPSLTNTDPHWGFRIAIPLHKLLESGEK